MVSTTFHLMDEAAAAKWLRISVRRLRELRDTGRGPHWFTLPTDEVRYHVEELDRWSRSGGRVIHVTGDAEVVALPGSGVRVRHRLPDGSPRTRLGGQLRGRGRHDEG